VDPLGKLLFAAAVVAVLCWGLWPRCSFLVRLEDGVPRVAKGKVVGAFLENIQEVCAQHGVRNGVVRGMQRGHGVALAFSDDFPEPCRQRLRNIWAYFRHT
jgi:hypothetical protein